MLSVLQPYRLYAYLALALAAVGGYVYWHHKVYDKGHTAGAQSVQVVFDEYRGKITSITEQRKAENAVKLATITATNEAALNAYQTQLSAIADDRDSLARRLRNHAGACSAILPAVEDQSGTADASTFPGGAQTLDEFLDAYDRACQQDAVQLDALLAQIKPQL